MRSQVFMGISAGDDKQGKQVYINSDSTTCTVGARLFYFFENKTGPRVSIYHTKLIHFYTIT
jgi:hypothetical protein